MSTAKRLVLALSAVLISAASLLPAQASATEVANLNYLSADAAGSLIAQSRAEAALGSVEMRLAAARGRLAIAEERLPGTPAEEAAAAARAVGAAFVPSLADQTDRLAADRRVVEAARAAVAELEGERSSAAAEVLRARFKATSAQALLEQARAEEAAALEAARVAEEERLRAEQAAIYGVFPVAGPNEYIDSWGFRRSGGRRHKGTDIMAPAGTPVVAVKDGEVRSGNNSLGGLIVWLEADDGTRYYYAHLSRVDVSAGRVTAGQVLGAVGSTGNASASAPHLHFEVHRPGATNPYPLLRQMVA